VPELREATPADVPVMLDIFFTAMDDLDERRRRPAQPRNPPALEAYFRHLISTDPASSMVADDHGRRVAFGIVLVREGDAFLSFLFVLPAWQGRGLGRAVLRACLEGAGKTSRLSTCAEADQLISTGLYASMGMAPRDPIYLLRGELAATALPGLPAGVTVHHVDPARVAALDLELVGYRRPQDHAFWSIGERRGWMLEGKGGEVIGYGYAHPSGRIGPVAASQPELLPVLLGQLVRSVPVIEGRQVVTPGAARTALESLLAAGMRLDGTPAVYCAERPGPRLDRYLPMSFALL
jgi:GNAT superfamily N-acetyltransferase